MNTNKIRANYDKLTPRERFAALVAASVRKDTGEITFLESSTPKNVFDVPDTWGLSEGFRLAKVVYLLEQLHGAAVMFLSCSMDEKVPSDELVENLYTIADCYRRNTEVWRRLCAEYGIDPQAMMENNPYDMVLEVARKLADGLGEGEPEGVEERLANLREMVNHEAETWGAK
jgi:hypothetical protein